MTRKTRGNNRAPAVVAAVDGATAIRTSRKGNRHIGDNSTIRISSRSIPAQRCGIASSRRRCAGSGGCAPQSDATLHLPRDHRPASAQTWEEADARTAASGYCGPSMPETSESTSIRQASISGGLVGYQTCRSVSRIFGTFSSSAAYGRVSIALDVITGKPSSTHPAPSADGYDSLFKCLQIMGAWGRKSPSMAASSTNAGAKQPIYRFTLDALSLVFYTASRPHDGNADAARLQNGSCNLRPHHWSAARSKAIPSLNRRTQ